MKMDYWKKFIIAALAVGIISVVWNFIGGYTWQLAWINLVEKVFIFLVLGLIISFFKKDFIELNDWWTIGTMTVLIAAVPTGLEFITGALAQTKIVGTLIVRLIGGFLGIVLVNYLYKWK